jgi:hypothetical protein
MLNLEKFLSIFEKIVSAYLPLCVYTQIGAEVEKKISGYSAHNVVLSSLRREELVNSE